MSKYIQLLSNNKVNHKTTLIFFIFFNSSIAVSLASADAGAFMHNIQSQIQFQKQYKPPQEKINIFQNKIQEDSKDQNNTTRAKFLKEQND